MAANSDEDALSWRGDSDPTLVTGKKSKNTAVAAGGSKPDASKDAKVETTAEAADEKQARPQISSFLLVVYSMIAGVYVVYTVLWVIATVQSTRVVTNSVLTEIMAVSTQYLAIASCALWFAGVYLLTRHHKAVVRLLWLFIGLALLIPWPFVLNGLVVRK